MIQLNAISSPFNQDMPETYLPTHVDLNQHFINIGCNPINLSNEFHFYDITKGFSGIVNNYSTIAFQDLIRSTLMLVILSPKSELTIINKLLTAPKELLATICDSYFYYYIQNTTLYPKGSWRTHDNRHSGVDLYSLIQFITGSSEEDVLQSCAKYLDINFSDANVPQCGNLDGHTFIRNSHPYPYFIRCSFIDIVFGKPTNQYCFHNDNGYSSFYLQEWHTDRGTISLFFTLQQNNKTGERVWEFIAPPHEYMIFNRHLINHNRTLEVHIHDDIARAWSSNYKHAIATWAGDLSISSQLDWSCLKERKVAYIFDKNNRDSMLIGGQLIQKFRAMKTNLELCTISN